jgi:hypothetical protein
MTERRDRFTASLEKRNAVEEAENNGTIADSIDVRMKLMEQVKSGEKTLKEVQTELAKIKRDAKRNGKQTRNQVFCRS